MAALSLELSEILRQVSRSFNLTIRAVPAPVRAPIALGYLLARATDTVADTEMLPQAERLGALAALDQRIAGARSQPVPFATFSKLQTHQGECRLLERIEEIIQQTEGLPVADLLRVRTVLETIISGQKLDLERFASATLDSPCCLKTDAELEDYTYRVAGSVGEFWTKLCRAHLFPTVAMDELLFLEQGIQFGKGLQLVNILRDLPRDLKQGRCYLPQEKLLEYRLTPEQLMQEDRRVDFNRLYRHYLERAQEYLRAGWHYTLTIPRSQVRLRLACAWPVLIGIQTVQALRDGPGTVQAPVKIPRSQVKRIIGSTLIWYPFKKRWERLFDQALSPG